MSSRTTNDNLFIVKKVKEKKNEDEVDLIKVSRDFIIKAKTTLNFIPNNANLLPLSTNRIHCLGNAVCQVPKHNNHI